jgi:hypothetical protein
MTCSNKNVMIKGFQGRFTSGKSLLFFINSIFGLYVIGQEDFIGYHRQYSSL